MPIGYLFLVVAACILFAMAIDSILTSFTLLNISAAIVLLAGAVIAGSTGLSEFFLLGNTQWLSVTMFKVQNAAVCFVGFAFLFFSFHFPRDKKMPNTRYFLIPALIVTAVMVTVSLLGWDIKKTYYLSSSGISAPKFFEIRVAYKPVHYVMQALSVLAASLSIVWIGLKFRSAALVYQKKQIRYFLAGIAFFLMILFALIAPKSIIPPFLAYPLLSAAAVIAGGALLFTVVTYRFVNLRKSVGLFIRDNAIGLVVALPLALLLFILRPWLQVISLPMYFAVMPAVLVLFFWLFELSRELLKRVLRLRTAKQDITENFLDRIGSSTTTLELARNTVEVLVENINCRNADFLAFNAAKESYETMYSSGGKDYSISAIDPFFRYLKPETPLFDREAVNFDPNFSAMRDSAERYFERHEASLIVSVFYENNPTVILNIAGKIDNTSFASAELDLIAKLRKITQVVLNNILLFEKEQEAQLNKRDLSLATVIQESIFQKIIPVFTGMDVAARLKPARGVSGDYFLVEKVNNNSMGVIIADVAGKGFPASLISMMIHTVAKSQEFSSVTTNSIVTRINDVMTANQDNTRLTRTLNFATVFCGFIDHSIKTLFYTNAGHNPLISYDPATGVFDSIKSNAKPPGIFPDQVYISSTYRFTPGRIFVLYSDGITETINDTEEEFGVERLYDLIRDNAALSAENLTETILRTVEAFAGDREQFDDITLVVIKL